MYAETFKALKNKIFNADWSPDSPVFVCDHPDRRVQPNLPTNVGKYSVSLTLVDEEENLMLHRPGEEYVILGYDDIEEDWEAVPYPMPYTLTFQVDIRSGKDPRRMSRLNAFFKNLMKMGGYLTGTWAFGTYNKEIELEYLLTETQLMNNEEGDGLYRTTYRFDVTTWLFSSYTPVYAGMIKYRLFDVTIDDELVLTADPDGYT